MNAATQMNDDLLDSTLDDLADLPEFKPFPPGSYKVTVHFEEKEINKKPAVELKMKLRDIIEVPEIPEDGKLPEPGKAETQLLFILRNDDGSKNEISQGQLKKVLQILQPAFGGNTPREIMAAANGAEVGVVLKTKFDKKNEVYRQNLHEIAVV